MICDRGTWAEAERLARRNARLLIGARGGISRRGGFRSGASDSGKLWVPTDGENLRCWLDAALGVTEGAVDDVISWEDTQSGVGNVFTDGGIITRRPTRIDSAINGKPGIQFDGLTDWLTDTSFSWGASASAFTIAMVYRQDSLVDGECILTYAAGNRPALTQETGNLIDFYAAGAGSPASVTTTAQGGGAFKTIWGRWDGATQYVGTGATQEDSDANANAAPFDNLTLAIGGTTAGTALCAMTVAEILVYRSSDSTLPVKIAGYFARKYGVPQ